MIEKMLQYYVAQAGMVSRLNPQLNVTIGEK